MSAHRSNQDVYRLFVRCRGAISFYVMSLYSEEHDSAWPWFFKEDIGSIVWQRTPELITFVFTHPAAPLVVLSVCSIAALGLSYAFSVELRP